MGRLLLFYLLIYLFLSGFILTKPALAAGSTVSVNAKVALSDYWADKISESSSVSANPPSPTLGKPVFIQIKLRGLGNLVMSNRKLSVSVTTSEGVMVYRVLTDRGGQAGILFIPKETGFYRINTTYLDPDRSVKLGQTPIFRVQNSSSQLNFSPLMTSVNSGVISSIFEPVREKL